MWSTQITNWTTQFTQITKDDILTDEEDEDVDHKIEQVSNTEDTKEDTLDKEELSTLVKTQREELTRLRLQKDQIQNKLSGSESTRNSIVRQYSTLLKEKEDEIEVLKVQLDKETRKNDDLRRRKSTREDASENIDKLKKEIEVLNQKNTKLNDLKTQQNITLQKLRTELDTEKEKYALLLQQQESEKEQVIEPTSEVTLSSRLNSDPSPSIDEHQKTCDELNQSRDELNQSRDELNQSRDTVIHLREEFTKTKDELTKTRDELQRAHDDLTRLRNHMINAEKDNEETVLELKNKLEVATAIVKQGATRTDNNVGVLYERQKKELISTKAELEDKNRELDNLQAMIEQLNYDQAQEIDMRTLHLSNEIKVQTEKISEYEKKLVEYENVYAENSNLKTNLENLREMLDIKTREFVMLQKEYQPLHTTLDQTLKKLNYELKNNQDVIDKQIVTKLIVTYFTSPRKNEVLEVMAGILNFSEENKLKVGLQSSHTPNSSKKGWLGGWFSSSSQSTIKSTESSPVVISNVLEGKNFADLWIEFLLHEAENERNNTTPNIEITSTTQTTVNTNTDNSPVNESTNHKLNN